MSTLLEAARMKPYRTIRLCRIYWRRQGRWQSMAECYERHLWQRLEWARARGAVGSEGTVGET